MPGYMPFIIGPGIAPTIQGVVVPGNLFGPLPYTLANVKVTINDISVPILYAGPQPDFAGLDQVNVPLILSLRGSGESNVVLTVDGQSWLARPLDDTAGESLWALVPEGARRVAERRFWFAWALSLVAATGVALVAGAVVARSVQAEPARPSRAVGAGSATVGAGAAWSAHTVGGPTKERGGPDTLEALHAVAVATGSGDDLVATAERTLEVVCGVARAAFGGLFRLDPVSQTLVLVAHRGLSPEDVAVLRVRPLDFGVLVETDGTAGASWRATAGYAFRF